MAPEAIIHVDTLGNIADVNHKFCNYASKSAEELIGTNVKDLDLFSQTDKEFAFSNFKKALQGEIIPATEMKFKIANNQTATGLINRQVIRNAENEITGIMIMVSDISPLKGYESKLIEAKVRAEKSDRLKTEFLAQMSHEIRTPLNTIFNFTSLIEDELGTSNSMTSELSECFSSINSAGTRIIRTVDLILNMSEIQNKTFESLLSVFNLYERVIHKLFIEYSKRAEMKGLSLSINRTTDDMMIHADEYTVEHIILNILDNAIKYTERGNISIEIFSNLDGHLSVSVKDTGIGIAEEYLSTIFKPFSQEEQGYTRKYDGTGLGLALVKKYCTINNATIQVVSSKGEGATFTVNFRRNALITKNVI